jgi:hypothetical protein
VSHNTTRTKHAHPAVRMRFTNDNLKGKYVRVGKYRRDYSKVHVN